jgi:LPS-assembly protein
LAPVAAALLALAGAHARAQQAAPADADRALPIELQADSIRGQPDLETVAEGSVVLKRGSVVLRADRLSYDQPADLARARGNVRITRDGDWFAGPELELRLQRFEGFFLEPTYYFERTGGGGRASRVDFIDRQRAQALDASYTSCPLDGSGGPAWLLSADRVRFDLQNNEGVAHGAVLRFYGVPILGAPVLSFPLTSERKSGWLPPSVNLDNRSGFEFALPYYWNIAPHRDATFTPAVLSRRGVGLQTELRYLEPHDAGEVLLDVLPEDRTVGRARHALRFVHEGDARRVHYAAHLMRVSDDDHWKDFPRVLPSLTPRLLPQDLQAERGFVLGRGWSAYARVQHWQVLQDADFPIVAPYQRSPQFGLRSRGGFGGGLEFALETEVNRFTRPESDALPGGTRWHAIGTLSRPWTAPGWWFTPRMTLNAASYRTDEPMTDGRRTASRVIPTVSADAGALFERDAVWFGHGLRQTLEPRLLYLNTPFRTQAELPNFDAAAKDFNEVSVFSDNAFSGVDRVADAHQLTAGVTTRLLDPGDGGELLRLGLAQRFLFRDQQVTPDNTPITRRVSDLLLLGSSQLTPRWIFDTAVQYSPDAKRLQRSILRTRYSPGPFKTVSAGYRLVREASEQLDIGWQWPVYGPRPESTPAAGSCRGTFYSVGRLNYSLRDSRITDSLFGVEYDAGCWIARVVAERVSTGRTEATTRLLFQLELVGLSRLGSNPLQVLKDNIPGYRLLREDRSAWSATPPVYE